MNRLFPLPLYVFLKIVIKNGGISAPKLRNILPWLLKVIAFEPLRWIELTQTAKVNQHHIEAHPIIVLGFYRSGTTYLQQFLLQDDRLGYHSVFQMVFPEIMLTTESWLRPVFQSISEIFKAQDPVHRIPMNWQFTGEEDASMTTSVDPMGAQWGFFFPQKMKEHFDRFVLFEHLTEPEKKQWIDSFLFLLKKISLANQGKQLILKSPPFTARLKLLYSLFPQAKFILIHRNPYEVFASNQNFWKVAQDIYTIGKVDQVDFNSIILHTYAKTMERYIAEKHCIPSSQLIEIAYADFIDSPISQVKKIYQEILDKNFNYCEQKMIRYAEQQKQFKRIHHQLSKSEKELVAEKWAPYFRYWGYPLS